MRPEARLMLEIRKALAHDKRAMVVPNFVGLMVPAAARHANPITVGLGKGSADLVGLLRGSGRYIALEVKTPTGKVSLEQTYWLAAVRQWGGFACVVRSIDDALAAVTRACRGEFQ